MSRIDPMTLRADFDRALSEVTGAAVLAATAVGGEAPSGVTVALTARNGGYEADVRLMADPEAGTVVETGRGMLGCRIANPQSRVELRAACDRLLREYIAIEESAASGVETGARAV
ncbi:hypothetical protein CKO28_17470 [Rhodovibrio sodomensis]|uniref:YbaB/EbfC DNA-binding family protein n=1 Tax=Rhodovibrio sodomensis TaxID=1088 RepID=A0ABS1DK05_9PROT|nr:hypothetical protein [Rhodovibrio sodomensis]MBK1669828.1 hypothetical protein [Rhodovibrio sodomensis]